MEPINNIRWLDLYRPEHSPRCQCAACVTKLTPRLAAFVILFLAVAAWSIVAAVMLSLV